MKLPKVAFRMKTCVIYPMGKKSWGKNLTKIKTLTKTRTVPQNLGTANYYFYFM